MTTIVFVSLEPWDEVWRRNQFLCDGLLRRNESTRILFVQPPSDNSHAVRSRNFAKIRLSASLVPGGYEGRLQLLTPTKWLPNTLPLGRKLNESSLERQVKQALVSLGWKASHLWVNQHEAASLVDANIATTSLYDITDDWTKFSGNQSQIELVVKQDKKLCMEASHVIVCSEQLFEDKRNLVKSNRLHLIPNGVHVNHYNLVTDRTKPLPLVAQNWKKPVFGYTGTIHGDRIDIELISRVAQANSEGTIAMVGPNLLEAEDRLALSSYSNIIFTGPQPYGELPAIMRAFDVCIVPHLVTSFTESLNPIKLWEYLAAGKPIVSMNVAGFKDFPELIHVSDSHDGFLKNLGSALPEFPSLASARKVVAQQHSWDKRIDEVVRILGVDA